MYFVPPLTLKPGYGPVGKPQVSRNAGGECSLWCSP